MNGSGFDTEITDLVIPGVIQIQSDEATPYVQIRFGNCQSRRWALAVALFCAQAAGRAVPADASSTMGGSGRAVLKA